MRTNEATEGMLPSRTNNINQPGGQVWTSGGAVIVQVEPEHDTAGKMVLEPKLFPCVLETIPSKDTLIFDVSPDVIWIV